MLSTRDMDDTGAMFAKGATMPRTAHRTIVGSVVCCCMLASFATMAFAQRGAGGAANAAPRPAAAAPLEDRRPPLFLKETFPMPKKEEIYISQLNISDPNVELKLYGQTLPSWQGITHDEARRTGKHGGLEVVWRDTPKV